MRSSLVVELAALTTTIGTIVSTMIATFYGRRASQQSKRAADHASAIDYAVNQVEPGEPRLLDKIDQLVAGQLVQDQRAERIEQSLVRTESRLTKIEKQIEP